MIKSDYFFLQNRYIYINDWYILSLSSDFLYTVNDIGKFADGIEFRVLTISLKLLFAKKKYYCLKN